MAKKRKAQKAKRKPAAARRKSSKRRTPSKARRRVSSKRKTSRAKPARRVARARPLGAAMGLGAGGLSGLNYSAIESEIQRLTQLLHTIRKKNKLVRRSLAYLEREQKKVARQIQDAKRFLTQLKNRGMKALREFPDNAEEIFSQLKLEISKLSRRLGIS